MSVQAGIWNFDGEPVDPKLFIDFGESLKQQGPDGESTYVNGNVAMLYRPFHTTAESRRERQPYFSKRGFVLTWDGRIDNRENLIAELRAHLETDPTDADLVATAFDHWDTDCFRQFVGDWAVSIWKPEQRELVFASDYMAIRHIFYYLRKQQIWWSTDLSPLVLLSGHKFHIDDGYIAGYFARDPDAHLTPYQEIREVPPGAFVRIRNGNATAERYWRFSPRSRIRYKTDAEYEDHFRHVFRQSVRRRLRSDSAILAELSGGLDSSSIVCMADDILAKESLQTPSLDTLSFYDKTEPHGDDWIYFQKIEAHRGRTGYRIDVSNPGDFSAPLEFTTFNPLPGSLGLGRHMEAERAAVVRTGSYRVALSGVGGDDLMGGVPDPRAQLADLIVQCKLGSLAKQLLAWSLTKRRPWIQLVWQASVDSLPTILGQYLVAEAKLEPWIRKSFAKRARLAIMRLSVGENFGLWLPTRRAYVGGVLAMANKLAKRSPPMTALEESRYPFLDQNLIEFVLSIPANQLLRPGERRSLMRRSLAGIVPQEILCRRTKQVGARGSIVVIQKHWDELQKLYQSSLSSDLGYINEAQLLKALSDARAGRIVSVVRVLWAISLELWLRDLSARRLLNSSAVSVSPLKHQAMPIEA